MSSVPVRNYKEETIRDTMQRTLFENACARLTRLKELDAPKAIMKRDANRVAAGQAAIEVKDPQELGNLIWTTAETRTGRKGRQFIEFTVKDRVIFGFFRWGAAIREYTD